jgi:hypothetical protein
MFLSESFGSLMNRDWRKGNHGKTHTESQHKKRKASGRWKFCNIRVKIKPKLRWNKKKGIQEKSKKHSKILEIIWCR